MDLSLTKNELRALYKAKRMALSQDEVNFLSQKLRENFILQFNPIENQKINVFLSIKKFNEVNTQIFIDYFFENKIRVFVPKIKGEKIISVEIFPDSEFEINSWGIKEPVSNIASNVELDYVLTPLLYCDEFGNRVGYGKGFYDQFFTENYKVDNITVVKEQQPTIVELPSPSGLPNLIATVNQIIQTMKAHGLIAPL